MVPESSLVFVRLGHWSSNQFNLVATLFVRDNGCLLGSFALLSGKCLPMFQWCLLPSSSGRRNEGRYHLKTSVIFYQVTHSNNPEDSSFLTAAVRTLNLTNIDIDVILPSTCKSHKRYLLSGVLIKMLFAFVTFHMPHPF